MRVYRNEYVEHITCLICLLEVYKVQGKRTAFFAFSGKRDELAKRELLLSEFISIH